MPHINLRGYLQAPEPKRCVKINRFIYQDKAVAYRVSTSKPDCPRFNAVTFP